MCGQSGQWNEESYCSQFGKKLVYGGSLWELQGVLGGSLTWKYPEKEQQPQVETQSFTGSAFLHS